MRAHVRAVLCARACVYMRVCVKESSCLSKGGNNNEVGKLRRWGGDGDDNEFVKGEDLYEVGQSGRGGGRREKRREGGT